MLSIFKIKPQSYFFPSTIDSGMWVSLLSRLAINSPFLELAMLAQPGPAVFSSSDSKNCNLGAPDFWMGGRAQAKLARINVK